MTPYKYLGKINNNHYCTKIYSDPSEEITARTTESLMYSMFVEMQMIRHNDDKIVIFEFFSHRDFVIAKIIQNNVCTYRVADATLDKELDEYDAILNNYLKENTHTRIIKRLDISAQLSATMMTEQFGNLDEENRMKKGIYVDFVTIMGVDKTLPN